jgi:hypothetical protein
MIADILNILHGIQHMRSKKIIGKIVGADGLTIYEAYQKDYCLL